MIRIARDGTLHPQMAEDAPAFTKFLEHATERQKKHSEENFGGESPSRPTDPGGRGTESTSQTPALAASLLIVIVTATILVLRKRRSQAGSR